MIIINIYIISIIILFFFIINIIIIIIIFINIFFIIIIQSATKLRTRHRAERISWILVVRRGNIEH